MQQGLVTEAELDDALQLHLSPTSANIRRAQCANEFVGAVRQARRGASNCLDLAAECCKRAGTVFFNLLELQPESVHSLLQRCDFRLAAL